MSMLRSANEMLDYKIQARDDQIGKAADLYFDDLRWQVRYLVVQTGNWLKGRRKLLISPHVCGVPDWESRRIPVTLTRKQVGESPLYASDAPVSEQYEKQLSHHYDWPYWRLAGQAIAANMEEPERLTSDAGDPHLRSIDEVRHYRINARDGEIGHIADFIIDLDSWRIAYLVIDTSNWLPGRKVLLAPTWAQEIDWIEQEVAVDLQRETIKSSPPYQPGMPVSQKDEQTLLDYYGRPHPTL